MKAIYVSAREWDGHARLAKRPIVEVMSKPVVTVSARAMLEEALIQMIQTGLRHLAVVDDEGRCLGMLSDRAIAAAWASDYGALAHRPVASALAQDPAILDSHRAVVDAAKIMRTNGDDAVAIVDTAGAPVGVVTGSDLVSLLAK